MNTLARLSRISLFVIGAIALLTAAPAGQERPTGQGFSFKTGVDLINVTVDGHRRTGRFVAGLKRDDFVVYEDGKPQTISQFDAERVPVSLGIALDTSGSMLGEKIVAAQAALNRFLFDLLGPQDEVFLYRFDSRPELVQGWTTDRARGRPRARLGAAVRRDGDVRHGRRGDSARAAGRAARRRSS